MKSTEFNVITATGKLIARFEVQVDDTSDHFVRTFGKVVQVSPSLSNKDALDIAANLVAKDMVQLPDNCQFEETITF